ncbi:MAG: hypothetical protein DCC65_04670 [Planctomycetota bacterium]|nr:MAG: hypothetical protein DCC65_04670 [Planctomycetota bacterium]
MATVCALDIFDLPDGFGAAAADALELDSPNTKNSIVFKVGPESAAHWAGRGAFPVPETHGPRRNP